MQREQQQIWRRRPKGMHFLLCSTALYMMVLPFAAAQDIRGIEVCTAEKQMERRTGCLQANIDFLQQALAKLVRETQEKIAVATRDLATARAEIVTLKSTIEKLTKELTQLKAQVESSGKK